MTFSAYGYASMYITGNMPLILISAMVIFGVWTLSVIKGLCVRKSNSIFTGGIRDIFLLNRHGYWMINFTVRFFYEIYLIMCVSCLISLRKAYQEHVIPELNAEHDPDSGHALNDKALAIIMLCLVIFALLYAVWRVFRRCLS